MRITAFTSSLSVFLSVAMLATAASPRRMPLPTTVNRLVVQTLPAFPDEQQLRHFQSLQESLIPIDAEKDPAQRKALAAALTAWLHRSNSDDHSGLRTFVVAYPLSRWTPSLLLNLGLLSYDGGRFTQALTDWRAGWESAKSSRTAEGKIVADAALTQYCRMLSRLGRKAELKEMLQAGAGRDMQGSARQRYSSACEALAAMENRPGRAYRCGPYALASVKQRITGRVDFALMHGIESPEGGFSLTQVSNLAKRAGLRMVAARRRRGSPILVPSVVHWKLDHYGALLEEKDGRYLLKDPTFGSQHWVTKEALEEEASGAFLVIMDEKGLPEGWRLLSLDETSAIRGKGFTCSVDGSAGAGSGKRSAPPTGPRPRCTEGGTFGDAGDGGGEGNSAGSAGCSGMAGYGLQQIPCSVVIQDSPVGYTPAFGPLANFQLSYNQRAEDEPMVMSFTNFGHLWSSEFVSYLEDDPGNEAATVTIHLRNGGFVNAVFNPQTSQFIKEPSSDSLLVRINPNVYERRFGDGSKEVYGQALGTSGPSRKVFLTQVVDPQGRALTLIYDTDPSYPARLKYVLDAAGLATELFYDNVTGYEYRVKTVRDPFDREAAFFYKPDANVLQKIRDVAGLESSFDYGFAGLTAMTTPYGKTKFAFSTYPDFPSFPSEVRFVEATDPMGGKERIEYRTSDTVYGAQATAYPWGSDALAPSAEGLSITNAFLLARNVFYWDKKAMSILHGSVTADPMAAGANATIFHYLHVDNATTAGILESVKRPLESRTWFNYPGQLIGGLYVGSSAVWSAKARVIEDGNGGIATEITKREVNSQGQITKTVDPLGRETLYEYDTNGIDLRFVKVGEEYQTIKEIQYNPAFPPHLPWKIFDAAGQPTIYAYNSRGQVTSITNALGEVTTFGYEDNSVAPDFGKLKLLTGALPGATTEFTYDPVQRIETVTDSSGYILAYNYDNLDRLMRITYPDGTYEENVYDRLDIGERRDRMGRITQYWYNPRREMLLSIDPAQRILQFDHCSCGSMDTLIDGNGNRTSWDFDVQGRQTSKRYADGRGDDFTYEPLSGRLSSITDAKRQTKKFTYNLDGTLRKLDYQNEQIATPDVTYTYDPDLDRLQTMADGVGTHTYEYYPVGVLGAMQIHTLDGPFTDREPLTDLITYTYDELGRTKTRNIGPTGNENKVTWGYDSLGRIVSEVDNLCPKGTQFTYNYVGTTGRLQNVIYPNGQIAEYDYWPAATFGQPGNGDFRLKEIANYGQRTDKSTLLSRFDYTYDTVGNIITWRRQFGVTAVEQTYTLGYDEADELTKGVLAETANPHNILYRYYATYDKGANRLTKQEDNVFTSFTYNNLNQLTATGGSGNIVVRGHTDEPARVFVNGLNATLLPGNLYEALVPITPGGNEISVVASDLSANHNQGTKAWNVTFEGASPATILTDGNGNVLNAGNDTFTWNAQDKMASWTHGGATSFFLYDGLGRRVAQTDQAGIIVKQWVWCGLAQCEETSGDSQIEKFHLGVRADGISQYFSFDHLGSIREGTNVDGEILKRWDYSSFGRRIELFSQPGSSNTSYGFTGLYHLSETIVAAPFRDLVSDEGRWFSRDPIAESDNQNLYSYVRGNPLIRTDPTGLFGAAAAIGKAASIAQSYCTSIANQTSCMTCCAVTAAISFPAAGAVAGGELAACSFATTALPACAVWASLDLFGELGHVSIETVHCTTECGKKKRDCRE